MIDEDMFSSSKDEWKRAEEEPKELSYKEMKDILKERDVSFKGNASKEELIKLLEES